MHRLARKTRMEQFSNPALSVGFSPITLSLQLLRNFSRVEENWVKNYGRFEQEHRNSAEFPQKFKSRSMSMHVKKKFKILLSIRYSKLDGRSNDTTHKTLYDDYINQTKLSEQKNRFII